MATQTLVREALTPFQSRLFTRPGTVQLSEISEFQAQKWRLGEKAIDFHIALSAPPLGPKIAEYFDGLGEIYPQVEEAAKAFRPKPWSRGGAKKFSLAIMPLKDATANTPLGMVSLGIELNKSKSEKPEWLLSLNIEAVCTSPHRAEPAIEHMLCAGIADLLYDEISALDRQARSHEFNGTLHIGMSSASDQSAMHLFAARLRSEIQTVVSLINQGSQSDRTFGMRIMPPTEL